MPVRARASSESLVAYCGLFCGACRAYLQGRCRGCRESEQLEWCRVRTCCIEHGWTSCADCTTCADPGDCPSFNSFLSKVMGVVLNSDRRACIRELHRMGRRDYAAFMASEGRRTLPRR